MPEENQNHYAEFWGKIAGYGRFQIITEPVRVPGSGLFLSNFTTKACVCSYKFKGGDTICLDNPHESVHPPTIRKNNLELMIHVNLEGKTNINSGDAKAKYMILTAIKKFPHPRTDKDDGTYKGLFWFYGDKKDLPYNDISKLTSHLAEFEKNPEEFRHHTFEIWKKVYFQ